MKLSKILATGLTALTLATPVLANKQFCTGIFKEKYDVKCESKLKKALFYSCKMDDWPDTITSFSFPANALKPDLTVDEFYCINKNVKKITGRKYNFIIGEDERFGIMYKIIRSKSLFK